MTTKTSRTFETKMDLRRAQDEPERGYYTQEQLDAAFKLVQDEGHWKMPVDCKVEGIPAAALGGFIDLLLAAVPYFTATNARIEAVHPEAKDGYLTGTYSVIVKAAGYYAGPAN
jgi:hypothetical protein